MKLLQITTDDETQLARQLFLEYAAGIGISLCFQNFDDEVASLPGKYAPPDGRLLLAYLDDQVGGCIALRKLDDKTCEMKRLFVRPGFRGLSLGRQLVNAIVSEARVIGYKTMRLDTMPGRMDTAIALYQHIGFKEIAPYYDSPVAGTKFMELVL